LLKQLPVVSFFHAHARPGNENCAPRCVPDFRLAAKPSPRDDFDRVHRLSILCRNLTFRFPCGIAHRPVAAHGCRVILAAAVAGRMTDACECLALQAAPR